MADEFNLEFPETEIVEASHYHGFNPLSRKANEYYKVESIKFELYKEELEGKNIFKLLAIVFLGILFLREGF